MKDRIDAIVQAVIDHQAMEDTRSYLERGRRFEGLTVDALNDGWAAAFTAVCAYGDERRETDLDDFGAGLGLRNLNRPHHLIPPESLKPPQQPHMNSRPPHSDP